MQRLIAWLRSLDPARRNLLLAGSAAVALGLLIFGFGPAAAPPPAVPVEEATRESPAAVKPKVPPDYAWAAALTYLQRAGVDGEKAIGEAIEEMDTFFAERQAAGPAFAKAVLDFDGKAQVAVNLAAGIVNGVSELAGQGKVVPQDQLMKHIRMCFERHVLSEAQLRQALDAAVAGYATKVRETESRLLVNLQADLADDALDLGGLPPMQGEAQAVRLFESSLDDTLGTAGADLFMSMGKFAASWVGGDMLSGAVLGGGANPLVRFGGDMAAGSVVEQGVDAAVEALGYRPQDEIAANAMLVVLGIRERVLGGDEQAADAYFILLDNAAGHPDETVRSECGRAAAALEKRGVVGLWRRLRKLNMDRHRHRAAVIYRQIYGPDAPLPPEILPPPVIGNTPVAELIERARAWATHYGG